MADAMYTATATAINPDDRAVSGVYKPRNPAASRYVQCVYTHWFVSAAIVAFPAIRQRGDAAIFRLRRSFILILSSPPDLQDYLVYGGNAGQKRSQAEGIPWSEIGRLIQSEG